MPIIFLDIDGVLNNAAALNHPKRADLPINQGSLVLMQRLCDTTSAKCILSSDRRFSYAYADLAQRLKLPIIGQTGDEMRTRGEEIEAIIQSRSLSASDYIIIDDRSDFSLMQSRRLVQTSYRIGFTKQHYRQAIQLLSRADY